MNGLRLLDLFCGAGGCAKGYQAAGFYVVGVDVKPQPRYCGDDFFQGDALDALRDLLGLEREDGRPPWFTESFALRDFAAIHASPPCQAFTDLKDMHNAKEHDDLVTPTRELLDATGLPYVIENVEGAPMTATVTLCGSSFGLGAEGARLQRHRLFETNWPLIGPPCAHGVASRVIGVYGGHGRDRRTQDFSTDARREAMGIDWMTGAELSQAIPPAYTELIGHQLMQHIRAEKAAA